MAFAPDIRRRLGLRAQMKHAATQGALLTPQLGQIHPVCCGIGTGRIGLDGRTGMGVAGGQASIGTTHGSSRRGRVSRGGHHPAARLRHGHTVSPGSGPVQ
jgi:hypothetical protein